MLVLGAVFKMCANVCMFVSPMLIDDIVYYVQQQNSNASRRDLSNQSVQVNHSDIFFSQRITGINTFLGGAEQQSGPIEPC